jgi:hypothetical protein
LPRPDKSKLGHKAHDALLDVREAIDEIPEDKETTEDFEKLISKYENILSSGDENKSKNTPPQSISSKSGLSTYNKKEDSWDSML